MNIGIEITKCKFFSLYIIDPQMPYRLMILESSQAETGSLQFFPGNGSYPLFGLGYHKLSRKEFAIVKKAFVKMAGSIGVHKA